MGYPALDWGLGVTSYFCNLRSPWQKGAVENANGRLRRYPQGHRTDADRLEELASLARQEVAINGLSRWECQGSVHIRSDPERPSDQSAT